MTCYGFGASSQKTIYALAKFDNRCNRKLRLNYATFCRLDRVARPITGRSLCMATRPHKIQKVTDRDTLSSSPATSPAATAQSFSKDLQDVLTGQELWQQQRTKWVGNSTGSSRPASRPVIR
ncbi:TPA: hypothetical protein ACH3X3_002971 [Trebouxia sp. C0006]